MRGHWRGWTGALLLSLGLAGIPAHRVAAQAEESDEAGEEAGEPAVEAEDEERRTERARELFGEGIELVEQERWEEAAAKFRATLDLKPAPAVRYNLASALYSAGQVTEAEVLVDEVLDDPDTDDTIRSHAQELQRVMREEAGKLRVELAGSTAGSTVAVDGYELPPNRVGIDVAASPGSHVVIATRDGREVAREEATVAVGETTSVHLDVAPDPATAAAAGLEDEGEEPEASSSGMLGDWRIWVAIGATAAVVIATVVLLATASGGTEDPVEGNFEPGVLRW